MAAARRHDRRRRQHLAIARPAHRRRHGDRQRASAADPDASGGRPGDALYVTGSIGAAAAGLGWLQVSRSGLDPVKPMTPMADASRRHRRPEPRLRLGMLLGRNRAASACMDLSDGLADAVRQIAEASGTGATIDAAALPIDPRGVGLVRAAGAGPGARGPERRRRLRAAVRRVPEARADGSARSSAARGAAR